MHYKIGTRGSKLALVQAEFVRDCLQEHYPQDCFELKIIKTKGDKIQNKALSAIGDKGLFVKEIEQELYVVTNMLIHDVETILTIMHLRWNIENNGFRTLKQRYNLEHIFIGEINAINYMVQIIFLAFNLLELYMKIRLKECLKLTWSMITKCFEDDLRHDKTLIQLFNNSG